MAKQSSLWTASRVVAAALLMAAAAAIVPIMIHYYPDERWDRDQRELTYLYMAVGLHVGFNGLGRKTNTDQGSGFGLGLRAVVTMCAWILGLMSIWYGIEKMKVHGYDEPVPAVLDMFKKLAEYFWFLMHPKLLGIIALFGVIAGMLTEKAGKHWK